jgi:hypothetical protein
LAEIALHNGQVARHVQGCGAPERVAEGVPDDLFYTSDLFVRVARIGGLHG